MFGQPAKVEAADSGFAITLRCRPRPARWRGFVRGWVDLRACTKLRGDQHSAQIRDHVLVAGMGLGRVPASPLPMLVDDAR
jgi:hypothetical protein